MNLNRDTFYQITDYLMGELSAEAQQSFERRMTQDPSLADEVKLQSELIRGIQEQALIDDLQGWYMRRERLKQWGRWGLWVGVAASLAWLLFSTTPPIEDRNNLATTEITDQTSGEGHSSQLISGTEDADRDNPSLQNEPNGDSFLADSGILAPTPMLNVEPIVNTMPPIALIEDLEVARTTSFQVEPSFPPEETPVDSARYDSLIRARQLEDQVGQYIAEINVLRAANEPQQMLLLLAELSAVYGVAPHLEAWFQDQQAFARNNMKQVPGGQKNLGTNENYSVGLRNELYRVLISTFHLDSREVTAQEFCRFLNVKSNNGKDVEGRSYVVLDSTRGYIRQRVNGEFYTPIRYENFPAVGVTFWGARDYAVWVGKRLPTEAELKYASITGKLSLCADDHEEGIRLVDRSCADKNGIRGLMSNVAEWCQDWYQDDYQTNLSMMKVADNPSGPERGSRKMIHGDPKVAGDRLYYRRNCMDPNQARSDVGFRCAWGERQ